MKKCFLFLLIGVIALLLGTYQNSQYELFGQEITVTVSDIKTRDDTDDGPVSYAHTYYADYTFDGKEYKNIKVGTSHTSSSTPNKHVGDEMTIVINPKNPENKMAEGGIFITVGLIMSIWNMVLIIKNHRTKDNRTISGTILIAIAVILATGIVGVSESEIGVSVSFGVISIGFMCLGYALCCKYLKSFGWGIGAIVTLGFSAQMLMDKPVDIALLISFLIITFILAAVFYKKAFKAANDT